MTACRGANFANAWSITAGDAGSLTENANVLTFSGADSLIGGTNTDGFTLAGGTLSGSIAGGGGGGVNTLTGDDVANTWGVTGNDSGTLTGITSGYTDIDNLVGGSDTDAFNFTDGVVVTGSIDGNAGSDTLNLSAYTTARTVVINATSTANGFAGTEASIANGFADIDVLSLPAGAGDSLQGANFANAWSITAGDVGSLTENANVLTFSGADSLIGGTNTDGFTLAGGTLSGSIAGGGGAGVNTLTGDDVANTWTVTALDTGTLTGVTNGFSDIDNLIGGTDTDGFTLAGGTLSGSIAGGGGAGINTLTGDNVANTWTVTALDAGTLTGVTNGFSDIDNLIGGTDTDGFTLVGGTLSGSIAGGGGAGVNTQTGDDVANTGGVTGDDSGTLTGITSGYTDIDNLVGGSDTDAFNFTDGVVVTGSIDGNAGSDTLNLSAYTTARTVVINATSTANGFAGTEASIANGFADIDVLSLPAAAGDSLQGADFANAWSITAGDAGSLTENANVLTFSGVNSLIGGTDTDGFTLAGGTLSGSIAGGGGGGVNTLTGDDVANTWGVTGNDSGTLTGITSGYTDIDNLAGGSDTDAFNFTDGVVVTGSIDGNVGSDTLNLSAYTTARTVVINATSTANGFAGTEASIANGFADIDVLSLPAAAGDSLQGADFANVWSIIAVDAGSLTENANVLTFSGVNSLIGGTNTDGFTLAGGTLSGSIAGGGGGVNTLTGDNVANTWTVTALDAGTLTGVGTGFSDIDNLIGGSNTDGFTISNTFGVTGTIDGGAGTGVDSIILTPYSTPLTVNLTLAGTNDGMAGNIPGVTAGPAGFDNIDVITGTGNDDSLNGFATTATWTIDGGGTENYLDTISGQDLDFSTTFGGATGSLTGGSGNDTFLVTASFTGNLFTGDGTNKIELDSTTGAILTGNITGGTGVDSIFFGNDDGTDDSNNDFTMTGDIDGGAGADTLNYLDSGLTLTVNSVNTSIPDIDGTEGTITGTPNLLNEFNNINTLFGNGGTIVGPNADTWWDVTGLDSGTFGNSLANIGVNAFNNFTIQGGSADDVFIFQNTGRITFGIDGNGTITPGDTNYLIGTIAGIDIFNITNAVVGDGTEVTYTTPGALTTILTNINIIGSEMASIAPADLGDDSFTIDQNWAGDLNGVGGNDIFTFANAGSVTGAVAGGIGSDTLVGDADGNAFVVTGADTGTLAVKIGTTWSAIENLTGGVGVDSFTINSAATLTTNIDGAGGTDTLIQIDGANAWAINTGNGGTLTDVGGTFANIENLTGGTGADVFSFTNIGSIAGAVVGGTGGDTLVGDADGNAFVVTGADTGTLAVKIGTTWSGIENLTGGAGTDFFTINSAATLTTNIDGAGGGNDVLVQVDGANAWLINAVNGGTVTDVGGTFANIEALIGGTGADGFTFTNAGTIALNVLGQSGTDTLTGDADGNVFVITGANTGTLAVKIGATWSGIENLTGGAGNDLFSLIGTNDVSGTIDGQGGSDTLDYSAATAKTITLTNIGTLNGFRGTGSSFDNINTIIGSGGTDTLIGLPAPATWVVSGGGTTYTSTNALTFSAIENLTGGTGVDTFNITGAHSGNLSGGAGNDVFNLDAVLTGNVTGGAGANTYNPTVAVVGTVDVTGTDTWNHTAGVSLATTVTGGGSLTIPGTNDAILDIGTGANDLLVLPALTGFTGHLIIGGTLAPAGTDFLSATGIDINSTTINVNTAIDSGGSVTLLAGDLNLVQGITAGPAGGAGALSLVAAGEDTGVGAGGSGGTGIITGPAGVSNDFLVSGSASFIAVDTIVNPGNIFINLDGGIIEVATGEGGDVTFAAGSPVTPGPEGGSPQFNFVLSFFSTALNITTVAISNPAADLIGVEELGFIDTGLFEQDLTLFGVIGQGIALALAQCEEIEGCAPNVTEEELDEFIAQIEARLDELHRRSAEAKSDAETEKLEELIAGYQEELENFISYREQLQEYLAVDEEEFDEDFDEEDFGVEPDADAIQKLGKMLETINARIQWLESLKGNPEDRARLSESTGIELTQEALDAIIEGARSEGKFIERQIKLLQEGTEAGIESAPMFIAEAGDHSLAQIVNYGPSLLNLGNENVNWVGY